jgi:hypothetical protein
MTLLSKYPAHSAKRLSVLIGVLTLSSMSYADEGYHSPNGQIGWNAVVEADSVTSFSITHKGVQVLTIADYGQTTKDGGGKHLKLKGVSSPKHITEQYDMLCGKQLHCSNEANEVVYTFTDDLGREQRMVVRIYNDGVAFRYELDNLQHTRVNDERTTYRIEEGTPRWIQRWTEPYEEFFPMTTTGEGKNRHWGYPALVQSAENTWALISEAGIERQHSASSLRNDLQPANYKVMIDVNHQNTTGTWISPWRVVMAGELADIVKSTLITDVSAPCRLEDTSWIIPGSVSWVYWAYNRGSKDFQIVKKYIDMAYELRLPYVLIDWEWDIMGNGGTITDALKYAKERNVKVLLWYNSSTAWTTNGAGGPLFRLNAPENRDKEFAMLESMGVAGVKIDFFSGDLQETMEYCIDLIECAAKHHLLINLHGATIPRGWQRTYPNLMSVEAVYGAEWYNNLPILTNKAATHNATLPFTRNVIGSMDYTPCTFSDSQHPHITTHAHELALSVLYESALQHWADKPESYLPQPEEVRNFMSQLPTIWDETRLLSGYPGKEVLMIRRKSNTWYVAAINGTEENNTITIDWSFLNSAKGKATLFQDGKDKSAPWNISKTTAKRLPKSITMQPRGGFIAVISAE